MKNFLRYTTFVLTSLSKNIVVLIMQFLSKHKIFHKNDVIAVTCSFLLRWTSIILVHVLHKIRIFNHVVHSFVIDYEDSNIIEQKLDSYESKYKMEQKEKGDEPKDTSPSEQKFITDTLQKERTGMIFISTYSLYIRQIRKFEI